jgi:hypothetical protein
MLLKYFSPVLALLMVLVVILINVKEVGEFLNIIDGTLLYVFGVFLFFASLIVLVVLLFSNGINVLINIKLALYSKFSLIIIAVYDVWIIYMAILLLRSTDL